ncbi:MAG: hypothetical protein L0Y66_26180, partial [Myxococcaceae bacterium]|nr:hypothetical protein [Myxococcaceae bacterium]
MRAMALVVLCVVQPLPALAQDSVRLRFAPRFGAEVHRVFRVHTRMEVAGPDGAAAPRELVDLGGVQQIALAGPQGEPVVHLAFDSLRTLLRQGSGPWREVVWAGLDSLWAQAWPDAGLRVQRVATGGATAQTALLLQLLGGGVLLTLPGEWLRAGDGWTVEHAVPLASVLSRAPQSVDTLTAHTRFVLDSTVTRASDTLAFLTFQGAIVGGGIAARHGVAYSGGLTGSLIWSTGWS